MKPSAVELKRAVAAMTVLKFFPSGDAAMAVAMDLLARMVATREQLNWLTQTLIDEVGEWPGPAQLRALFCTHFPPADGVGGPYCTIAGYTPADGEARYLQQEAARGYLPPTPGEPRCITGEVERVSECQELAGIVDYLAKKRSMLSTPLTRRNDRNRVKEALQ